VTFYFTFGSDHPFKNKYVAVNGTDSFDCRLAMSKVFGRRWGFEYSEERKPEAIDKYGLTLLTEFDAVDTENLTEMAS